MTEMCLDSNSDGNTQQDLKIASSIQKQGFTYTYSFNISYLV